jgi:hypothetical protein
MINSSGREILFSGKGQHWIENYPGGKMNLITLFHLYAVVITLKNGLFSALKLGWIKNKSGLETSTPRATTEMRAVWGGLLLGLGIAGLVFPLPEVYKTIGIVYVVRNLIRGISMVLEKSTDRAGLQAISYEVILAIFLFL